MDENLIPVVDIEQLIAVTQLPIIEERLREKAEEVKAMVAEACEMAFTEENLSIVKSRRAEMNKVRKALEDKRKAVKAEIMRPYESFNATFKECVSDPFDAADKTFTSIISENEYQRKTAMRKELDRYYSEHLTAAGLSRTDWPFEMTGIEPRLSDSMKALKARVTGSIKKLREDLALIECSPNAAEVMVEYKKSYNAAQAILAVEDRHKAAEAAQRQLKQFGQIEAERREAAQSVPQTEAVDKPVTEVPEDDPVLELHFTVTARKSELKALKKFLIEGGYNFE